MPERRQLQNYDEIEELTESTYPGGPYLYVVRAEKAAVTEDGSIVSYHSDVVPGWLQTTEYTREEFAYYRRTVGTFDEEASEVIRGSRREILIGRGIALTAFIGEGALKPNEIIGDRSVLERQKRSLIHISSTYPNVSLRIVPDSVPPDQLPPSSTIIRLPGGLKGFVEERVEDAIKGRHGDTIVEGEKLLELERRLRQLAEVALDQEESLAFLKQSVRRP